MRLALLGDPVDHSLSPSMHEAALADLGIEGSYTARRVDEAGFVQALDEVRDGHLHGVNVTMPHKHLAHTMADVVSTEAAFARSVNTMMMTDDRLAGISTDIPAIRVCWQRAELPTDDVVILGSGGAAAAALVALAPFVTGRLALSSRRPAAGSSLLSALGIDAVSHPWGRGFDGVVVNATPLGMRSEALPGPVIDAATGLFDMAYGPQPTPAVTASFERGLAVVAGQDMLVEQAALSFEWWTGSPAPRARMRSAAGV